MRTYRFFSAAFFMLLLCGIAYSQSAQQERLERHVYYFASDSLKGRGAGTVNADKAARYIVRQFEEIGLEPFFDGGYFQPFEMYGTNTYKNVVAVIPGNDPSLKDEYIIIGAHYDHLGIRDDKIYNGADDNASGSAAVIEVARILKARQDQLKRSVIVAAFDAEESGLWGSKALADTLDLSKVKLMMSIDMVGWLHEGKTLQLEGAATIKDGRKLLESEARKMQLNITAKNFETKIMTATDTQGFAKESVPTLAVTTGLKSPYHKPEDDADLIDYQGLDRITSYMADVTECFANQPSPLPSGKIAAIHGGRKKALEIGPVVSWANSYISFPKAAFNGKTRDGFDAGIAAQANLSKKLAFEVKALYERLNAKYPDGEDLYGSSLQYHQESVVVPASLLFCGGQSGMDFQVGFGGYYGYILNGGVREQFQPVADRNQWGICWSVGFQIGKIKFSGERRYQLNPLFIGEGAPDARLYTGAVSVSFLF